jgi:hypothetical protein
MSCPGYPALKRRAIFRRSLRDLRPWKPADVPTERASTATQGIPEGPLKIARQFTGGKAA